MILWEGIKYVLSGLTLTAFLGAVIAWVYKSKIEKRERLIVSADPKARADLVRAELEVIDVDVSGLTKEQKYQLVLVQTQERAARFKTTFFLICVFAFILTVASIIAVKKTSLNSASSTENVQPKEDYSTYIPFEKSEVNIYVHPGGSFEREGQFWVEYPAYAPGKNFRFQETHGEKGYLTLADKTRHPDGDSIRYFVMRIPRKGGMAQWSYTNPFAWQNLYSVDPKAN